MNCSEPCPRKTPRRHGPFIRSEWEQLQQALERAYLVTIFGCSEPATDVEARTLLLKK